VDFDTLFEDTFVKYTNTSELISLDSVHSGMLTQLVYSIHPKKTTSIQALLADIRTLKGNNKVTLVTGYSQTDL
jgi:hypothetical protein